MTMRRATFHQLVKRLVLAECATVLLLGSAIAQSRPATEPPKRQTAAQITAAKNNHAIGERKFRENCSRCHTAPEQLPPRIAGTIVMHMRVRASLSDEDAKDILRYLSP